MKAKAVIVVGLIVAVAAFAGWSFRSNQVQDQERRLNRIASYSFAILCDGANHARLWEDKQAGYPSSASTMAYAAASWDLAFGDRRYDRLKGDNGPSWLYQRMAGEFITEDEFEQYSTELSFHVGA